MILSLDEMKGYLRVDFNDDDQLIEHLIAASENLCADIARLSVAELSMMPTSKIAVIDYLDEQTSAITEYSESLTRRLVEKVTIYGEKIVVTLKSGMEMEVEA